MRYVEARDQIKSGDLLAWRGTTALGRLIRIMTGGSWTHIGIAWVFEGRVFALSADQTGVRLEALSQCLPFDWIRCHGWTGRVQALALADLGRPYSFANAVLAPMRWWWPSRGRQCAQYAGDVLKAMGLEVPALRTPSAIVEILLQQGGGLSVVTDMED